jgi:hypothetical protein
MESTSGLLLAHNLTDDTLFSKGYRRAKNGSTEMAPYNSSITVLDGCGAKPFTKIETPHQAREGVIEPLELS